MARLVISRAEKELREVALGPTRCFSFWAWRFVGRSLWRAVVTVIPVFGREHLHDRFQPLRDRAVVALVLVRQCFLSDLKRAVTPARGRSSSIVTQSMASIDSRSAVMVAEFPEPAAHATRVSRPMRVELARKDRT